MPLTVTQDAQATTYYRRADLVNDARLAVINYRKEARAAGVRGSIRLAHWELAIAEDRRTRLVVHIDIFHAGGGQETATVQTVL